MVRFARALTSDEPALRTVRVSSAGILTWGTEELVIDPDPAEVGRAVCISSGGRLAFRRVLGIDGTRLRLRCDVAPFEDVWEGSIVGCVRPRLIDAAAAIDPEHWTSGNWTAAIAYAHALSVRGKFSRKPRVATFTTRMLADIDWPLVRAFWRVSCGDELHVEAQPHQHVVGLFDGSELVGANIHLVFGKSSYSAYTLVDRRYRGSGGGSRMIAHAVENARAQNLESIYVHINARNLPSIRAYQRAGFVEKGWWSDEADPLASAERQWRVLELDLA
ncbi:MAG: GNAT family N-acetyltransferase [Polyangiaceae bacterium]